MIGLLAALYQACYFTAVSLTSVPLATLVTIGTAPVIVLGAERVAGRRTGHLAAAAGLARPPWPTRCTSAACGPLPPARPRC